MLALGPQFNRPHCVSVEQIGTDRNGPAPSLQWNSQCTDRYKLSYIYQRPSPFGAEGIGAGEDRCGWDSSDGTGRYG